MYLLDYLLSLSETLMIWIDFFQTSVVVLVERFKMFDGWY